MNPLDINFIEGAEKLSINQSEHKDTGWVTQGHKLAGCKSQDTKTLPDEAS